MSKLYKLTKGAFRRLVPARVQTAIWRRHRSFPVKQIVAIKGMLERRADHDAIYDETYYRTIDVETLQAAQVMVPAMIQALSPKRVIDVGCGSGAMLKEFSRYGVGGVGLEHSAAAICICRERGLDVREFDLERPGALDETADMALSTEVAEHLPENLADPFVDLLCSLSNQVVMTAATPGQGGTDHVNEQPHSYWIEKFRRRGLRFDEELALKWRDEWSRAGIASCYWRNVMVFARDEAELSG